MWKNSKEFRAEIFASYQKYCNGELTPEAARVRAGYLKVWAKNQDAEITSARHKSQLCEGKKLPSIKYED